MLATEGEVPRFQVRDVMSQMAPVKTPPELGARPTVASVVCPSR